MSEWMRKGMGGVRMDERVWEVSGWMIKGMGGIRMDKKGYKMCG